ncbi:RelA/SpoT domain-containing protein [Agrococcus carbonis]|uniref:RelA/SpoT domain-containing protein n=1 Tax=Agrococcus carbonis TaxID=684552 RepID=A0A1H1SQZ1_9MICO|nr:RelA/SpoT domain-containing protein [Agrococcus carbonis]SDS49799.1 hypothetical protein SAMN04489719_2459 [Agrococcus carbonis]
MTNGWTRPAHSKNAVNRAGEVLIDDTSSDLERAEALAVVNNWRSSHGFPLNTIAMSLRSKATKIDPDAIIARRTKRMPSIVRKLARFPAMRAARMQDLGGCRAVVRDIQAVLEVDAAMRASQHKHRLQGSKDYIAEPKPDGYRGIHLVYQYRSDKTEIHNGQLIEVQIRTKAQHAWATAVETAGTFTSQALKSGEGDADWREFFRLASSAIALEEGAPTVPGTPDSATVIRERLTDLEGGLRVRDKLSGWAKAVQVVEQQAASGNYVLLVLDSLENTLAFSSFARQEDAEAAYAVMEARSEPHQDVVLVAADSINALRAAYPNYFGDTAHFVKILDRFLA